MCYKLLNRRTKTCKTLTRHKEVAKLCQKEADNFQWLLIRVHVGSERQVELLSPRRQFNLVAVLSTHEGQCHPTELEDDEDQLGGRPGGYSTHIGVCWEAGKTVWH